MKKFFTLRALILIGLLSIPLLASADATQGLNTLGGLVTTFNKQIVTSLTALAASAAVVAFFYGIAQYIWGIREGVTKQIQDGQQFMVWGLVALFVMFSVWGIIQYTQNIFGIKGQNTMIIPSVQIGSGDGTGLGGGEQGNSGGTGLGGGTQGNSGGTGVLGGAQTGLVPNGYSCFEGSECNSGYCTPGGNCAAKNSSTAGAAAQGGACSYTTFSGTQPGTWQGVVCVPNN